VQQKRLGGNFIETSELPYALQVAQQRNPVTLYSGACGTLCEQARALLNKRGVPHRDIDPSQPGEAQKMKQVTGDLQVPVLIVGSGAPLKGFDEDRWQAALDQASYPKTPVTRMTAIKREADKATTDNASGKTAGKDETKPVAKGEAKPEERRDAKGEAKSAAAPETNK
jgi:glutaredoxin